MESTSISQPSGQPRGRVVAVCAPRKVLLHIALALCACFAAAEARARSFGLATVDTAPSSIVEGQRDDLLKIAFSNLEVSGVAAELSKLGLRLESTDGTPLSGLACVNLVSAVEVYDDTNASGTFEPATDILIATRLAPAPGADGVLTIAFTGAPLQHTRAGPGQTRNYFVVVRFTTNASAQTPHTLRVTHLTSGPASTTAIEGPSPYPGTPLSLQPVADVSSSTTTATFNNAPTTSGIADALLFDPAAPTSIPLFAVFQDTEDAPAQMSYDITSISNPALLAFAGIDPVTGVLALNYEAGVTGSSQLTVRATDRAGKTVSTTFSVTVSFNHAPSTTGIGNVVIADPATPTRIPLFASFQDSEDAPGQLSYAITGNSNSGLFTFASIDPLTGLLALDAVPGAAGNSQITVRSTDRGGKAVSTTFGVSVALLRTYAEWAAFHFGAGNLTGSAMGDDPTGSGLSNFAKYAFGIDPNNPRDREGLPRLDRTSSALVFTHLKPKYATDLVYHYEVSTDLTSWEPAVNGVHFYESTKDLSDGFIRVNLLVLVPGPRVFLRARADQLPGGAPLAAGSFQPPAGGEPGSPAPGGENGGGVGAAQFTQGTAVFPAQTVISTATSFSNWITTADLDGDGYPDVLSAFIYDGKVTWYRNNGNETFSAQQIISTANPGASTVAAADFDGDGLLDVATGSTYDNNRLAWHKNLGGGVFGPQQVISTAYNQIRSVAVADLDSDGQPDLLCTGHYDNRIAWHRNLGGGNFGPQRLIGVISGPSAAWAPYQAVTGDLDGDGFLDVVTASINDNKVAWYRNNGNGTFGAQQAITTSAVAASTAATEDFDGDGWVDVICGSAQDNKVSFFRNLGDGTFGPRVVLTSAALGVFSVIAADLNGDGAPDVVSASLSNDMVAWYENLGGGVFGPQQVITTSANDAISVGAADLNSDGKLDVVSASQVDSKIAAYFNRGVNGTGHVAVATTDTAPSGILEGGSASLLRINVSNQMDTGANPAQLAKLAFLLEGSPGVPLTAAEAGLLFDRLQLFADTNGSNAFEPTADTLIETTRLFPLVAGRLRWPLASASPESQVPPGATRTFFVVATLKPEAAGQPTHTFRIRHLTAGLPRTIARDSQTGVPRIIGPVPSTSSSFVTALANQQPTTTGLPSVTVFDTAVPTSIPLTQHFNDAESGASGLTYSITGNSNANLFSFAGINPATGVLRLKYKPGVGGSASVTIRATDPQGKSVSTSVSVDVRLVTSLQTWANLYGGGTALSPEEAAAQLLRYAFALNPAAPGDTRQLPLMSSFGRVRILSHFKYRYAADLAYQYEFSSDLENWSVALNGVHYFEITTDLPNGLQQSDLVILLDWPQAFIRPRATLIP